MPLPLLPLAMMGGGAALGGLSSLVGNRGKFKQLDTMSPEQKQRGNWAGQFGQQQIQNPYQGFEPIARKAQSTFSQQTVPSLAERFTSMGSGSALSSPAFASQLSSAGGDLSSSLAAMMAQYGLQQQGLGQNLLGIGQRPQFENYYQSGGPSFLSGLLGGAGQGLGAMGGAGMSKYFGFGGAGGQQDDSQNTLNQILKMMQQRQ